MPYLKKKVNRNAFYDNTDILLRPEFTLTTKMQEYTLQMCSDVGSGLCCPSPFQNVCTRVSGCQLQCAYVRVGV